LAGRNEGLAKREGGFPRTDGGLIKKAKVYPGKKKAGLE
jgi:hypothetical protein